MNKKALVNFTTEMVPNPNNVVPGDYFVWLTRNNQTVANQTVPPTGGEVTFTIDEVGTYVARAVRLTTTNASIGQAVESAPVVVGPTAINVPASITITIVNNTEG